MFNTQKLQAFRDLFIEVSTETVSKEVGQAIAPLYASITKIEAKLLRLEELLERIAAMDNLQSQMKAGQAGGLIAAPERKVGKKKAAAGAAPAVKQISNAMLYFNTMWRNDPEFRAMYLGGDRKMLPTTAALLKVYGDSPAKDLSPEAKAECEAKFATATRTVAERKAECKQIWKYGLTTAHKNVLKTERVAWNTQQLEAARAAPLDVDNVDVPQQPTPA